MVYFYNYNSQSDNCIHVFETRNLPGNLFDEISIQTLRPDQTLYTFYVKLPVLNDIPFRLAVDRAAIQSSYSSARDFRRRGKKSNVEER